MTDKKTSGTSITIKKLEHSEIEITGEIPAELFDKNRKQAIENLGKNIDISGFRKGHVPENMLVGHVGEKAILEEMSEMTIGKEYKNIIIENKLDPIGRPEISITKMAMGNPLCFVMKVAVLPEIELGDYKKIAKENYTKEEKVEVSDKEIEDTILEIRKMHAQSANAATDKKDIADTEKEAEKKAEPKLPELNDEFVKKLGDFKDVNDLKEKLKQNILLEKEKKAADKKRLEMLEKIISSSKIDIPRVIVEAELDKMIAQLKTDIERMGMKFDDYMKRSKKTEVEMRKEFEKEAEKRAKIQLILNKIGVAEKITAPKKDVDEQVEALAKQYPEANKERVRIYVETTITNQKVFEFLEEQK